ncbi:U4/U6 small nuclear ribonucleoprotein PRP4 [Clonorchis sinensis]|uniref:U4/U6 small nuclear ribonucleoprotein PRP4 n=1 Tax=Clonorchis sinensis TaxID=79923 RepID=G7YN63_CLOSI|nr:U4/U6 small nuclear ribonucleoprotein PRP4 [Clonorchis sinensis]
MTSHVQSLRYDKLLRVGLNLTRMAFDEALFSGRLRLNNQKVLKKGSVLRAGDKLDMITSEDDGIACGKRSNRIRTLFVNRPPLALALITLLLCAIGLLGLDVRVRLYELKDPDVETHWSQLLLELSKLDFCISNSTGAKTLSESLAAAERLPGKLVSNYETDSDQVTHSVEQHVLLYPTTFIRPGTIYAVTADMRGRHIGIKGPLALQPFHVTFELILDKQPQREVSGDIRPMRLISCVQLISSKKILPQRNLRGACHNHIFPPKDASIVQYGRLEWTKRTDVFTSNRCNGRIRLRTDFSISDELLPVLKSVGERLPLETQPSAAEQEAVRQMDLRKKARQLQVSTEDSEVKAYLRQLGEPICLFGEDGADRRERLRMLLVISGGPAQRPPLPVPATSTTAAAAGTDSGTTSFQPGKDDNTVWYHQGPASLADARMWIAEYSLNRAKQRLDQTRKHYEEMPAALRKARLQEYHKTLNQFGLLCSQVGDVRPLSMCRFSPDGKQLATASWSGLCRVWSVPDCELKLNLRGHTASVCSVVWHPQALTQPEQQLALASSAQDGSVKLWSLDNEEPLADIEGHAPFRVSRVAFHPSGRFLATACFDHSWRLWDLEACEEVLHQEGHSKPVYDVVFHPDGSLALTTSLDSFARIWDLRTGRCIMFFEGHLEELLGADIADNGYHAATASADNTVRIWDLRQQQAIYVLPAHNNVVSSVRFEPRSANYILTSSFDKTAKLWGHPVWAPIKKLEGHNSKVVYADISPDAQCVATCSHDLTYKLWSKNPDL